MLALLPTLPKYLLFSPLFDYYYVGKRQICEDSRELPFKVAYSIGLLHFSRHSQNKVANIGILVLVGDCKKLDWTSQDRIRSCDVRCLAGKLNFSQRVLSQLFLKYAILIHQSVKMEVFVDTSTNCQFSKT